MAGWSIFGDQGLFVLCTLLVFLSCVLAGIRLALLPSFRDYRSFLGLLAMWGFFCAVTLTVPLGSRLYFRIYEIAAPVSWFFYIIVTRILYQKIFGSYRGIASVGKTAFYAAVFCVFAVGIGSLLLTPGRFTPSRTFNTITFIDRCLLIGVSLFLLMLVAVMARYPISIQRNSGTHALVVSLILCSQSVALIGDQWTGFRYTLLWNTITAGFDAVCLCSWAVFLTQAGDTTTIRVRRRIDPKVETRLLGQLDTLNGILLRTARK